jgi:hypothetical protein
MSDGGSSVAAGIFGKGVTHDDITLQTGSKGRGPSTCLSGFPALYRFPFSKQKPQWREFRRFGGTTERSADHQDTNRPNYSSRAHIRLIWYDGTDFEYRLVTSYTRIR